MIYGYLPRFRYGWLDTLHHLHLLRLFTPRLVGLVTFFPFTLLLRLFPAPFVLHLFTLLVILRLRLRSTVGLHVTFGCYVWICLRYARYPFGFGCWLDAFTFVDLDFTFTRFGYIYGCVYDFVIVRSRILPHTFTIYVTVPGLFTLRL